MALSVAENLREPWSRITDARILRPKDELRLLGAGFVALIAVLDSHDPSAEYEPDPLQLLGLAPPLLPNHHHVLMQLEGEPEILSTGMYVEEGEPQDLIFPHVTPSQVQDAEYCQRLRRMDAVVRTDDNYGLYYVSSQEQLTAAPEAQPYLNPDGGLLL